MSGVRVFTNPNLDRLGPYPDALAAVLNADEAKAARAEISRWPGYAPTPLLDRPGLARALGLDRLWYKDESARFGLKSFKALGGAYAILRQLQHEIHLQTGAAVTSDDIRAGRFADSMRGFTVTCATDGNHGRSVAWGARLFGCRAVIFIHETVSEGRRAAIASYGAEVRRVKGTYDDAVRAAADAARQHGWTVISDTSYPGYSEIPRDVMHGYTVMVDEAIEQLRGEVPTHVFVQAGVGGLSAAVNARLWQIWGRDRPRLIVVEPEKADGLYRSAVAGRPMAAQGDLETIMAGLACAEVSLLAWDLLSLGTDHFVTIGDDWAIAAVRRLADRSDGDRPIVAGETGVAGLAGVMAALSAPTVRTALRLDGAARVLTFGSEGDTDPEIYRRLVGRSADQVRGG